MNQHSIGLSTSIPEDSDINRLTLNISTRAITIFYAEYTRTKKTKKDFLLFLSKFDIVQSEDSAKQLRLHNSIYGFSQHHENILTYTGKVTLRYLGEHTPKKKPSSFLDQFVCF